MSYGNNMEIARLRMNAFMATPAYRPYLQRAPRLRLFLVTYDIYTDSKFGEPEVIRWSIYFTYLKKEQDGHEAVRLQHYLGLDGAYYGAVEQAQEALDGLALKQGWKYFPPKEKNENT